eukprot:9487120-Pyramimonas_sp.AAC.1
MSRLVAARRGPRRVWAAGPTSSSDAEFERCSRSPEDVGLPRSRRRSRASQGARLAWPGGSGYV